MGRRYRYKKNSTKDIGFSVLILVLTLGTMVFLQKSWFIRHPYLSSFYVFFFSAFCGLVLKYLRLKNNEKRSSQGLEEEYSNLKKKEMELRKDDAASVDLLQYEFTEYEDRFGYVKVFVPKYKHRMLAERILLRNLYRNEVVHHIDGSKRNNDISNLCVMDRTKHEQFHAWMNWKKEKEGCYPHIDLLKRELEGDVYRGILLERV